MPWVTTTIFLDQLAADESPAWETLADQFRGAIVDFARRLGLRADAAEDVAQETLAAFADGYRKGKYERDRGRLSSWLFGIADRQARNRQRKEARRRDQGIAATGFWAEIPDARSTRATWDSSWEAMVLERCLSQVRREFQPNTLQAFERVTLQAESPAEVAAALGISRNAVFVARHRVLKRLRALHTEFEDA